MYYLLLHKKTQKSTSIHQNTVPDSITVDRVLLWVISLQCDQYNNQEMQVSSNDFATQHLLGRANKLFDK